MAQQLVVVVHVDETHCNRARRQQARSNTHLEALYHGVLEGPRHCIPSADQGRSQRRVTTVGIGQSVNLGTVEQIEHLQSSLGDLLLGYHLAAVQNPC